MVRKILLLLVIFIALLPFWMWVGWLLTPATPSSFIILDKTVPVESRQEHQSFNFILTSNKYTTPEQKLYDSRKDYYGYFPLDEGRYTIKDFSHITHSELSQLAENSTGAYYTDTYGIFHNDWYFIRNLIYPPESVYGGLQHNDIRLLKEFKKKHKLILTEFNLLASPTSRKYRHQVETLFDMQWTGWTGRYFESLDSLKNPEIPDWLIRNYRQQNKGNWPFTSSGIVLVHTSGKLVILESEEHLKSAAPVIETSSDRYLNEFNIPRSVPYPFWFDIMNSGPANSVVSVYRLDINKQGEKKLRANNLPSVFPAVIEHDRMPYHREYYPQYFGWLPSPAIDYTDRDYTFYYFAGDFADNPVEPYLARLKGIRIFRRFLYRPNDIGDRRRFFWDYYYPLIDNILEEYISETEMLNK